MFRRSGLLLVIAVSALFVFLPTATVAAAPEAKGTVTFVFWYQGIEIQKGWDANEECYGIWINEVIKTDKPNVFTGKEVRTIDAMVILLSNLGSTKVQEK